MFTDIEYTDTHSLPLLFVPEKFLLRFKFDKNYPMEAPEVTFVVTDGWQAPERESITSSDQV